MAKAQRFARSDIDLAMHPDFGVDPFLTRLRDRVSCGKQHLEYMLRVVWPLLASYRKVIVAQRAMTTYTALGQFAVGDCDLDYLGAGHVLYVDYPGKGKTLLAKVPALVLGGTFTRFQGSPDNQPSDYVGNRILDVDENGRRFFRFVKGPAFGDNQLVDEVNRNSPKTLSALLQAISEGKVTSFGETYSVNPFVIFTMNPVETEGTYQLIEALLDRIMFKITGEWFTATQFAQILERTQDLSNIRGALKQICEVETVHAVREFFFTEVYLDKELAERRMGRFAEVTNDPQRFGLLRKFSERLEGRPIIKSGLSGRGVTHWRGAAKALAAFRYRDHVLPEDAKKILLPILRHRVMFYPGVLKYLTNILELKDTTETTDVILKSLIEEAW